MTTALRHIRGSDTYVSNRVFDGVRTRDAATSARDLDRARKALERLRAGDKRD